MSDYLCKVDTLPMRFLRIHFVHFLVIFLGTVLLLTIGGCALLPSHAHNSANAELARALKGDLDSLANGSPKVYESMQTNLTIFQAEEERLIEALAANFQSALITAVPTLTWGQILGELQGDTSERDCEKPDESSQSVAKIGNLVKVLCKAKKTLREEAGSYLVKENIVRTQEELKDAQEAVRKLKEAIEAEKKRLTVWNANLALLQTAFSSLPTFREKLTEAKDLASLAKSAKDISNISVKFIDANGKEITSNVKEIVEKYSVPALEIPQGGSSKGGQDATREPVLVLELSLRLAEGAQRRAEFNIARLSARKGIFEKHLSELLVADLLLREARKPVEELAASVPGSPGYSSYEPYRYFFERRAETLRRNDAQTWQEGINRIHSGLTALRRIVLAEFLARRSQELIKLDAARVAHLESIQRSAINDAERVAVIQAGVQGLVAYHEGGIKAEDIANIIRSAQTIALAIIAADVH
jgi:hypothetical protein